MLILSSLVVGVGLLVLLVLIHRWYTSPAEKMEDALLEEVEDFSDDDIKESSKPKPTSSEKDTRSSDNRYGFHHAIDITDDIQDTQDRERFIVGKGNR